MEIFSVCFVVIDSLHANGKQHGNDDRFTLCFSIIAAQPVIIVISEMYIFYFMIGLLKQNCFDMFFICTEP